MNYSSLKILGLRGFASEQALQLGIPDGQSGSGLTVIVGPNNSGKSTIFESFRALSQKQKPSFAQGRRNVNAGDQVSITITRPNGDYLLLKSQMAGGSECEFEEQGIASNEVSFFTLPSRRNFDPFFGRGAADRANVINNSELLGVRGTQLSTFHGRLFTIQNDPAAFNRQLGRVLGHVPNWTIDLADTGQYFLKFNYDGASHNSDGAGEGLLSVFTIVDGLYDSSDGDAIFIDEPELSLHPAYQRRLLELLLDYSATRQIVISTHSPYFISWNSIGNGGKIARTIRDTNGTRICQPSERTITNLLPLVRNLNNPHVFGLDAREVFFLDDRVILVEGQEDVIFLKRILDIKAKKLEGDFYGWGVGGAGNMPKLIALLSDLGFMKMVIVLDKNMSDLADDLRVQFPNYRVLILPTDDVRDKAERPAKPAMPGLIDSAGETINPDHDAAINTLIDDIENYLD